MVAAMRLVPPHLHLCERCQRHYCAGLLCVRCHRRELHASYWERYGRCQAGEDFDTLIDLERRGFA